jgi:adenylylsulfate kinase-like enzyme
MGVVMLTGPIGAGKTTIARELIAQMDKPTCYLEGDTFWPLFVSPDAGRRGERFRLIMRSMTAASIPLARGGYEVVLDFSFPMDFLETAKKILKEVPLDLVVVRPSLAVCARRAAERTAGLIADYARYEDFYSMFEGRPQNEIADDTLEAKDAARRIREGLDAGMFRVP